ncbi:MAG: glycosyltransferase family 4 protein [Nitrospirae bacterium]|nr:glycosyltransferase family 4 protein [Nitrospirota bacterium]
MKKKILILDTGKEWGGGTNSLLELLKRIDKNKYHFTVLFYNNYKKGCESDVKTEIEKLGMEFLVLEQRAQPVMVKIAKELSRLTFFFSRRLKKYSVFFIDYHFRTKQNAEKISELLKNLRIDLLYMNNQPSSNLEGIIASKITGIPALQHSRIETTLNSFEIKAVNLWLKKMICVSEGVKNSFIRQGVDKSKCVIVYNGIAIETVPKASRQDIRKTWGISDKDILIGTVGSLIKRKRIMDLIEATAIVAKRSEHPIKCMIIGKGPEKENLMTKVKERNLDSRIIFTDFQSDAISHINALDIFAMPSENEGLPRVILEAMLLGKPVIASDITGPSELVIDGETGFLVPAGQTERFADAMLRLIKNAEMRKQMGEKAKERIIRNFPIEKYVNDVENVFAEVLGH